MARERSLTGIVRPSVDEGAVERNVSRPLSEAVDRASRLTPDLNLSRARRQLKRLSPGGALGGALSTAGGAAAAGMGDEDVQEKQLSELTEIRRTLEKDAVTGGVAGGTVAGNAAGGILGSALTLGSVATAAGVGAAGLGPISAFIAAISSNAENGPRTDPGSPNPRPDTGESGRDTGRMDSNPIIDIPDLSDLQLPKQIRNFEWPSLPDLPNLSGLSWPEPPDVPNLEQVTSWPGFPDPPNLSQVVDWPAFPDEPQWVRDLTSIFDTQQRSRPSQGIGSGAPEGGDVNLLNQAQQGGGGLSVFGVSEQEIQRTFEQAGTDLERALENGFQNIDFEQIIRRVIRNEFDI